MRATEPAAYTAARLARIAEEALRASGALGEIPTPLAAVREAAGIRALEPVTALTGPGPVRGLPFLGALWFEERIAFVDPAQSLPRRRFTEAHEIAHALCPWHEAVLRADTRAELFGPVVDAIEREANACAGMLIFQAEHFAAQVAAVDCSIESALALADTYGASRQATLHRLVETSPAAAAMLLVGRFPRRDGTLPVWRSVESAAFRRRHGAAKRDYPGGLAAGGLLAELVESARTSRGPASGIVSLGDDPRGRPMRAQAYYNRHVFLVLLVERRLLAVSAGRTGPGS